MHELFLAQELFEKLHGLAREHGAERVVSVRISIGPYAPVVKDSFRFAFETLAERNGPARGAALVVEEPGATKACGSCGKVMDVVAARILQCPECGGVDLAPPGDDQIVLLQVEME